MDKIKSKRENSSLIEKISPKIFNILFEFFNNEKKYILPFLLSELNYEYHNKIKNDFEIILNDRNIEKNNKNEIQKLFILYNFFLNCKTIYKSQNLKENLDIIKIYDPIEDLFTKAEIETNNIKDSGLNYKKCFFNYLLNMPFINISPCCSLMNIIYWKDYYKKDNDNDKIKKKQKILNVILYLKEEIAKCRINDLFGEIIFNQNNYRIKRRKIIFDCQLFMKIICDIYKLFNQPRKIIVNGGDKYIKHNFNNKNEFIIENILFKLEFKSDSLLIIHRV